MAVHSRIWRSLGLDAGDTITVEVEADGAPIEPRLPPDLLSALERDSTAGDAFARKTPRQRREIVNWIEIAKARETRERRIEVTMELLSR